MPDVVTEPAPTPTRLRQALPYALEVVAVLALFAAVGAGCGWLWFQVWHQPTGTVFGHDWFTDEAGLRNVFDGTAWYVVLAAAGGLLAVRWRRCSRAAHRWSPWGRWSPAARSRPG